MDEQQIDPKEQDAQMDRMNGETPPEVPAVVAEAEQTAAEKAGLPNRPLTTDEQIAILVNTMDAVIKMLNIQSHNIARSADAMLKTAKSIERAMVREAKRHK